MAKRKRERDSSSPKGSNLTDYSIVYNKEGHVDLPFFSHWIERISPVFHHE